MVFYLIIKAVADPFLTSTPSPYRTVRSTSYHSPRTTDALEAMLLPRQGSPLPLLDGANTEPTQTSSLTGGGNGLTSEETAITIFCAVYLAVLLVIFGCMFCESCMEENEPQISMGEPTKMEEPVAYVN